jgi:hypothetical protein
MRSDIKVSIPDEITARFSYATAMEIERKARAYRARVIAELLADALVWLARLPRRLVEAVEPGGRKQGA